MLVIVFAVPEKRGVQLLVPAEKFPLKLADTIVPFAPAATNNPFPYATVFKSAATPVCDVLHVSPSGDVRKIPPCPTATYNPAALKYVIPFTEPDVPVVPCVHVIPSGDDITKPESPNATNWLFAKITPRSVEFATAVCGTHDTPSLDCNTVPFAPTARYIGVTPPTSPNAAPNSSCVVPVDRSVHALPLPDVKIVPNCPTAT
jgi:hypothetical protein